MAKEILLSAENANMDLPIQLRKLFKKEHIRQIEMAVGSRDMILSSPYAISQLQKNDKIDELLYIKKTPENIKLDVSWIKWADYYMLLQKQTRPLTNRDLRLLYESDRLFSSTNWQETVLSVSQKIRDKLSVQGLKNLRKLSPPEIKTISEKEWKKLIAAGYDKNKELNQADKIKSYIRNTSNEYKKKLSENDLFTILFSEEMKDMIPSNPTFYAFYAKLSQNMKVSLSMDHIRFINENSTKLDVKKLNSFIKKYGINGIYILGFTPKILEKFEAVLKKDLKDGKMNIHVNSYERIHFDLIQSIAPKINAEVLHSALSDPSTMENLIYKFIENAFISKDKIQANIVSHYLKISSTSSLNSLIKKTGGKVPEAIARSFLDRNNQETFKEFNNEIMQNIFHAIMINIDPDDSKYIGKLVDNMHFPIKFRNVQRNIAEDFILQLEMNNDKNIKIERLLYAYKNFSDNIEWPSKKKRIILTRLARQYARFLHIPPPKLIIYDQNSQTSLNKKERGYYNSKKNIIYLNIDHKSFYNFLSSFYNIIFMLHKNYLSILVKNNANKELSLKGKNDFILAAKILQSDKENTEDKENLSVSFQKKNLNNEKSSQNILALYVAGKSTENIHFLLNKLKNKKDISTKKKKNILFGKY